MKNGNMSIKKADLFPMIVPTNTDDDAAQGGDAEKKDAPVLTETRLLGIAVGSVVATTALIVSIVTITSATATVLVAAVDDGGIFFPHQSPSPPPMPPPRPPIELSLQGPAHLIAFNDCIMEVTPGIPMDFTNDGICQDGGVNSTCSSGCCELGHDAADCPPRYKSPPPFPPPTPPPPPDPPLPPPPPPRPSPPPEPPPSPPPSPPPYPPGKAPIPVP